MRDFSSRPRRRRATRAETALLAGAGLVLAAAGWGAAAAWRDERQVRRSLEQARQESEGARTRAQAFEASRDPAQVLALQTLLSSEAPPSRVVAALAPLLPGDVRLENLRLVYGSRLQVEMRVAARAASSYDLFLDRLEASALFAEVLPGEENREGELKAVVRAQWTGPGA